MLCQTSIYLLIIEAFVCVLLLATESMMNIEDFRKDNDLEISIFSNIRHLVRLYRKKNVDHGIKT